MFDYKNFKVKMTKRGHKVYKKGKYITVIPNNNYNGYAEGFLFAEDVIKGFSDALKFIKMKHFNTWIYNCKFKIIA